MTKKIKKQKPIELRIADISKDLFDDIKKRAELEKRSISKQAEYLLEIAVGLRVE